MIRKVLIPCLVMLSACGTQGESHAERLDKADMASPSQIDGEIVNSEGRSIGRLLGVEGPHGLLLRVMVDPGGLAPGWHGLHLHAVGNCDDHGVFKQSGGHVGKREGGHGLLNPAGPEGGDLPNIWAAADGSAGYEAFTDLTGLADLIDADGSALIIHAQKDDHLSQPIGGAGGRVACAVLGAAPG